MSGIFHTILYEPLFNALIFLYNTVAFKDFGVAIILLTVIVRFILYPIFYKSFRNQTIMQKIQPEIQRIQHDHKGDKEKQAKMMMELWKTHKVNPLSGTLLLFLQIPILIVLYKIFLSDFSPEVLDTNLYSFITSPGAINSVFLGLINLKSRSIFIVVLAAILQYIQGKLSLAKSAATNTKQSKIGAQMVFIGPILTFLVLTSLPAAVGIYWLTTSGFSIFQQFLINKSLAKEKMYGKLSNDNKENS